MDTIYRDREIIGCIESLLPTIEEAIHQMHMDLELLNCEGAKALLYDTAEAIKAISKHLLTFNIHGNAALIGSFRKLREAMSFMVDAEKNEDFVRMQVFLSTLLIPAYQTWKQEIMFVLSSEEFRYLQN